jgi:hypothetical protein
MNRSLPVLGQFSKAVEGGASLNFCRSGGKHCDRSCRHHPRSTAPDATRMCYAVRCEIRPDRQELANKLDRHEATSPAELADRAAAEIDKRGHLPWLRLSTNGSVPGHIGERFGAALGRLLAKARERGIPVHFPVETPGKAEAYRRAFARLATIRESAQTLERFISAVGPVSYVAGTRSMSRRQRVRFAKRVAELRTLATGRPCKVCPAVAASFLKTGSDRAKCGNCRLCADAGVDTVYPLH